ncbi:MAG: hypothetical protein JWR69_1939 [Pedosphaera sp.]|nr:hypothetical protein [Pedosphaera sp.]
MKKLSQRLVLALVVAALVSMIGTGCNTAHGFGQDVQDTGTAIKQHTP